MCSYINSRNRCGLPQQVCVAASMRPRLIRKVSIESSVVNSTLVVIKRWSNDVIVVIPVRRAREYPICRFQQIITMYGPSVEVKIMQFPMLVEYSCTVPGTQRCSNDRIWVDMAACFAVAHAYVALSRARSLQGLFILNYCRQAFLVDSYYVQFWNWCVARNVLCPTPPSQVPSQRHS